jgi:hypothetical protein
MEFNDFKNEILRRAKEADACNSEYRRAYQSNDYNELMRVIKDNFDFAVRRKVIDPSLIETYKDQFMANQIYCNVDVTTGFLLACDNATVKACDNATVEAWDNATVKAWGNAYITSYYAIGCKLRGNAIYRIRESNTVRYVSDNINLEKVPAYEPEGMETKQD